MFCLANSYRSGQTLRSIIGRSIQSRTFSPIFKHVVAYVDSCNPEPCRGGSSGRKRCGTGRNVPPKSGGGHQICYKSYVDQGYIEHDYKNMAKNRPISPALEVFKMTTPALMSIIQRGTGVIITFYALLLSVGILFLSNGIETYVSIIQSLDLSNTTVCIIKICVGLPFTYHYCNGIRFCIWNLALFLGQKQVSLTATLALVGCIVMTGAFAFI